MEFKYINNKTVFNMLVLTLIVDSINGFILHMLGARLSIIGVAYRMILIVYFLSVYARQNISNLLKVFFIIFYFMINVFYAYFFYNKSILGLKFDITENIRLMLSISIALGLIELIKHKYIERRVLADIVYASVKILCWVYILSLILGLGRSTYGDAGYKAIFNSTNGLNITLIVLFIFQIEKSLVTKSVKDNIYTLALVGALILLGTKSSLIFLAFYFIMKIILENKIKKVLKFVFISTGIIILIGVIINIFFEAQLQQVLDRQLYMFNKSNNSIITYIFSGRNELLEAGMQCLRENLTISKMLFGVGSYYNQMSIGALTVYSFKGIEMDLFDILFSNGYLGVVITYGICSYIFFKNLKSLKKKGYYAEIISFLSIIIFSITGGHVFYDAMASTYLGIVVALCYIPKELSSDKNNRIECIYE